MHRQQYFDNDFHYQNINANSLNCKRNDCKMPILKGFIHTIEIIRFYGQTIVFTVCTAHPPRATLLRWAVQSATTRRHTV